MPRYDSASYVSMVLQSRINTLSEHHGKPWQFPEEDVIVLLSLINPPALAEVVALLEERGKAAKWSYDEYREICRIGRKRREDAGMGEGTFEKRAEARP